MLLHMDHVEFVSNRGLVEAWADAEDQYTGFA
jgi:hypothetical protein